MFALRLSVATAGHSLRSAKYECHQATGLEVTPAEQANLVKLGKPLGAKIKEIIGIVSPRTFARWVNGEKRKARSSKPGRPRKPEEIRDLIDQMAKDTGWGYRRILGELKKLRIKVSRATVARILKEHGFDLGPNHGWQLHGCLGQG